jgi:hypothetical protein
MATKTVITYSCDRCGKVAKASEFRRFVLTEKKQNREVVAEAQTDLCTDCEREMHVAALPFFPDDEAENLRGIVR